MKLVNLAVKRPVTMIILVAVVIILGFFTFSRLSLDLYPDMKYPMAAVITTYSGAGPEEVESQVSKPLEGSLNTLANVKQIESRSSAGQSIILINYNWGTDMSSAVNDIREKTSTIEKFLPAEADKPLVLKMDLTMMPIIQVGISAKDTMSLAQLQSIADDVIEPRLSRIPGIAQVGVTGGLEREVKVMVDRTKLENYGLSLSQVNQVLQAENFNMSSGTVDEGQRQYFVRSLQQFESVDAIKDVAIQTTSGNIVYLSDIATIVDGYKDNTQKTRVDGGAAVGISCLKQSDANTVKACQAVKDELAQIQKELGKDLDIKVVYDQSTFIQQSLNSTQHMMIEGAILAMLVLFLFLRNGRSTLIIFTAIPLSIIATFVLMYFNNETLNIITLGGLALGIGRMVDDSIVVFENIYRHRSEGLGPVEAALTGASQVGNAVIASTLTILAVFLPVTFLTTGLASIIFKPLALTVSFAILCSLLVSLTVVPLMSSRMLTDQVLQSGSLKSGRIWKIVDRFGGWLDSLGEKYKELLRWCLSHRRRVVIIVTLLMVGSMAFIPLVGAEFLPKMDSGDISIIIESDKGSPLENTDNIVTQVESNLKQIPEVFTVFSSVGGSSNMIASSGTQTDKATISVKLLSRSERKRDADTVAEDIRQRLSNVAGAKISVSVQDATMGGSSSAPISIQVKGDDLQVLGDLSNQVVNIVRGVPGTREVSSSLSDGSPEMQIKIDRQRAATYGLTPVQISSEIKNALQGTVATSYRVEGDEVDVRVKYSPQQEVNLENLGGLSLFTSKGVVIKLNQVADFKMTPGPVEIRRIDKVRQAVIQGNLLNRDLNSVMSDIKDQLNKMPLPSGYSIEYSGQNKDMVESFSSLAIALLLAIILVYAVMAILYESFFNPFVIMFSVPTAIIGVVLSLLLTGKSFSVSAFIGIIMLVGIVVANAIVYVDYLKQLREEGMERNQAILEAGRVRLRPILMTAFATILAMFPLTLGLGEGSESDAPLAIVIIGGLTVSTFVTLVLVPVVYSIFDDWIRRFREQKNKPTVETEIEPGV
ncbi:MAG TPA: efflux RND transporter permease subunit [Syntrophomonadaceae bacterium]|nr:efflux RND transporter permease subunit [Syntrophomonadaceae bacterium]